MGDGEPLFRNRFLRNGQLGTSVDACPLLRTLSADAECCVHSSSLTLLVAGTCRDAGMRWRRRGQGFLVGHHLSG